MIDDDYDDDDDDYDYDDDDDDNNDDVDGDDDDNGDNGVNDILINAWSFFFQMSSSNYDFQQEIKEVYFRNFYCFKKLFK